LHGLILAFVITVLIIDPASIVCGIDVKNVQIKIKNVKNVKNVTKIKTFVDVIKNVTSS